MLLMHYHRQYTLFLHFLLLIASNPTPTPQRHLQGPLDSPMPIECNTFSTCYECNNPGHNCQWAQLDSKCIPALRQDQWITKLLQCTDEASVKQSKAHCNIDLISNDNETLVNLKPSQAPMATGLFCKFNVRLQASTVIVSIKRSNKVYFGIEVIHYKSKDDLDDNPPQSTEYEMTNVKEVNLFYYGTVQLSDALFRVKFITSSSTLSSTYMIIVIFSCSVIFVGMMVILLFFFIHYLRSKSVPKAAIADKGSHNEMTPIESLRIGHEVDYDMERIKLFNEKCPICLNDINEGSDKDNKAKVIVLVCFHGFHSKCLSTWLVNNSLNKFCPICHCKLEILTKDQIYTQKENGV